MHSNGRTFTEYLDEKLISAPHLSEMMSLILARGNHVRIRAEGRSMYPFIRNLDVVTIAPLNRDKIKLGDIVAFTTSKKENSLRLSMHRVVQKLDEGCYLIKGDNTSQHPNDTVPLNQILGRVIKIERNNRAVRFGTGRERRIVALLSRSNILVPITDSIRKIKKIFKRRQSQ